MSKAVMVFQSQPLVTTDGDVIIGFHLKNHGIDACTWTNHEHAVRAVRRYSNYRAVVICLGKVGSSSYSEGLFILRQIKESGLNIPCIVITSQPDRVNKNIRSWEYPEPLDGEEEIKTIRTQSSKFCVFVLSNPLRLKKFDQIVSNL